MVVILGENMNMRLVMLLVTVFALLFTIPLAQAQTSEVDFVDVHMVCGSSSLTLTWSHSSGMGSAILIVDYATVELIYQGVFQTPSGSVTVALSQPLDPSITLSFLLIVVDGQAFAVSTFDQTCTDPSVAFPCAADGRLTAALCQPLVVYPLTTEGGAGWTVYLFRRGAESGEFIMNIPAETFAALPAQVAANCTIASSSSGEVVAYKLTSGQYLISTGPDEEGKVFTYLFEGLSSPPVSIDTYVSGMPPEILPSCV